MRLTFACLTFVFCKAVNNIKYTEWLKVLLTIDRIYCTAEMLTFSESSCSALERGEKQTGGGRGREVEGRDWEVRESQRILKLCIFWVIGFVSVVALHAMWRSSDWLAFASGCSVGSLISQKNAYLNLVDFNGSSHTNTLLAQHLECQWIILEKVKEENQIHKHPLWI